MSTIKIKEDWKIESGLYKCPYCSEVKSKMALGSNIWRKHENGLNHKTNGGFSNKGKPSWNNGLSWEEMVGKKKAAFLKASWKEKRSKFRHSGSSKKIMSIKMKERYAAGWEVKCGRAPKIEYESPIAGLVKLDGNWELKVAKYLDALNVKWKRNKERFQYNNTIKGGISTHCPDFYVEDWNQYIEVKGYKTDLDEIKWSQFKYSLQIWDKDELKKLKIL